MCTSAVLKIQKAWRNYCLRKHKFYTNTCNDQKTKNITERERFWSWIPL